LGPGGTSQCQATARVWRQSPLLTFLFCTQMVVWSSAKRASWPSRAIALSGNRRRRLPSGRTSPRCPRTSKPASCKNSPACSKQKSRGAARLHSREHSEPFTTNHPGHGGQRSPRTRPPCSGTRQPILCCCAPAPHVPHSRSGSQENAHPNIAPRAGSGVTSHGGLGATLGMSHLPALGGVPTPARVAQE
jgi:hypothetical protein